MNGRTPSKGGRDASGFPERLAGTGDVHCPCPHGTAVNLTPAELARRWRLSVRTLERWRAARVGPAWLRINGRILYPRREVFAFERARLRRPKR